MLGTVAVPGGHGRRMLHLWAVASTGTMIDVTAPQAGDRQIFALVEPVTITTDAEAPTNDAERKQIAWALKYLTALKKTS